MVCIYSKLSYIFLISILKPFLKEEIVNSYFPDRIYAYIIPSILIFFAIIAFLGIMYCFKAPQRKEPIQNKTD